MNAHEFFEKFSIEEINKRTRISPISLRYIKNKEFEKIQRVKFLGFIKIIEKEFKIDLSELVEEYNKTTNSTITHTATEKTTPEKTKKHNTFFLFILAVILFLLGAYLLFNKYNSAKSPSIIELNKTAILEGNDTNQSVQYREDINTTPENNFTETNKTNLQNIQTENIKKNIPQNIEIIPNQKVWFRALNLENNKTVEYLTSNTKILNGTNWYIKFGHGNITINYGNQTITPDTKKIVRILFQNGKVEYLKKPNRYEK